MIPFARRRIPQRVRGQVFERDGGCCARCRINVQHVAQAFAWYEDFWCRQIVGRYVTPAEFFHAAGYDNRGHTFEYAHRLAVAEGGGDEPDNLFIYCIPCHKLDTAQVVGRAAKARRRIAKFPRLGLAKVAS